MSRLVNYGAGEITDRLTILALKILFGNEAQKDTKHFVDERNVLLTQIGTRTLNGKWCEAVVELAAVNGALWHAEDDLRRRRQVHLDGVHLAAAGWEAAARVAFQIQQFNDQRAALVDRINRDSGGPGGMEKQL
jgi:hypothetical protein